MRNDTEELQFRTCLDLMGAFGKVLEVKNKNLENNANRFTCTTNLQFFFKGLTDKAYEQEHFTKLMHNG